jgi:hypothetical protein
MWYLNNTELQSLHHKLSDVFIIIIIIIIISVKELGHLLTRSGLTYPKVSSKVIPSASWGSDVF